MKNVSVLIKKDLYESKNNIRKILINYCSPLIMILAINISGFNHVYFDHIQFLYDIVLILVIALQLTESTLFQTSRYIKYGIFEKYYLNKKLKPIEIYCAKYSFNLFIVVFMLLLSFLMGWIFMQVTGVGFMFPTKLLLVKVLVFTNICTSISFVAALIIKSESNITAYGLILFIVFIGFYKGMDLLRLYSDGWVMLCLVVLMAGFNLLAIKLCTYHRLVSK